MRNINGITPILMAKAASEPTSGGKPTETTEVKPGTNKTPCPVTQSEFLQHASGLDIRINGVPLAAMPRAFSTGSFGWYLTGQVMVTVNGKPVKTQVALNLIAANSKDAPRS